VASTKLPQWQVCGVDCRAWNPTLLFFDSGTQFLGNETVTLCSTKKYKNQLGMNFTPAYYFIIIIFIFYILNPCTQLPGNEKIYDNNIVVFISVCLQCFDAVGWVAGRASGL